MPASMPAHMFAVPTGFGSFYAVCDVDTYFAGLRAALAQAQAQADQDITTERFVFCRQVAEIIDRATTLPSLLRAIKREAVSCVFCGGSKRYAGKECTCVHLHKALSDAGEHPKAHDRATAPTPGRGRE